MNLPAGKPFKTNVDAASVDVLKLVLELYAKRFTGYLALCVKGTRGLEEATVLMDAGKVVGCIYEYYAYGKEYAGENAFKRFLNATAAKQGVMDIFEATADQLHLLLAFHEDAVFVPSEDSLRNTKVKEFSRFYEDEFAKEDTQQAPASELKRKLYALHREETAPAELPAPEEKT
ncbi:DUF2226 domain-containing protein [Candidatus Micrarchaeota archaeon]|nr:DUF2226 domain-containing protein [Candidatus Micrarchaeota archaeon]